jgi:hypothetical protein
MLEILSEEEISNYSIRNQGIEFLDITKLKTSNAVKKFKKKVTLFLSGMDNG